MRAGHAHRRWSWKDRHRRGRPQQRDFFAEQSRDRRNEHIRRQFALQRQDVLADHGNSLGLQLVLDQWLDFLDDHHLIDQRCQVAAFLEWHRTGEAELEYRRIRE